jgi:hypothetical protein
VFLKKDEALKKAREFAATNRRDADAPRTQRRIVHHSPSGENAAADLTELDGASIITELPESVSIAATISRERVVFFPLPAGPCSVVTRSFDSRTA